MGGGAVAATVGAVLFRTVINDGNRGFRRQAICVAPDVTIQHQVAKHTDAQFAEARQEAFQSRTAVCDFGFHVGRRLRSHSGAMVASSESITGMPSRTGYTRLHASHL